VHDRDPLSRWQRPDSRPQVTVPRLGSDHSLVRYLVDRDRAASGGAVVVDRLARRDPKDPSIQQVPFPEAWVRPEGGDERLLEHVVRVVRTDGDTQESMDRPPVGLEELLERGDPRGLRQRLIPTATTAISTCATGRSSRYRLLV
jgi:hypothetical protein